MVGISCKKCGWVHGDYDCTPAPVAPVSPDATGNFGELETVGNISEECLSELKQMLCGEIHPCNDIGDVTGADIELVTRSQAVEILAAERADKRIWMEKAAIEAERVQRLEADNAAQAARIKELEWKAHNATISNKIGEDSAPMLWSEYVEALEAKLATANALVTCCCGDPVDAHNMGSGHSPIDQYHYKMMQLEAKLAAAEKALEPFAKIPVSTVPEGRLGHVPDKHPCMFDLDGNVLFTASDIRKARAVLGGKPS